MSAELVQRRLSAIFAADVVGYSRLMGLDEAGTLAALKSHRREMADAKIAEHQGRIVKVTGDGMLVEFPSVVNAVACGAEIQRKMRERNADVPEDRRIEFRIGIHLGDIISEGNDIFGDGVNIAARIEAIAPPGGVAVSESVRDHVGNRLDLTFEDMGEQALKNIDRPVRIYTIALAAALYRSASDSRASSKPSIAVLPFTNMSGDPEQEYFSDGITEDIITDLSKVSGLSVIARNSVFTYKGKPADVQEVSRRFNVATVLEGSVRKSGGRVRITAQLSDGRSGTHLWADRYDRDLTDIFAIQDEIAHTIVEQLKVRLLPQEKEAIEATPTHNVEAYTYYLQGRHFFHIHSTSHVHLARRLFRKAIEIDPLYARAYAGLADCAWFLYVNHQPDVTIDDILSNSTMALELDPTLAEPHASYGLALQLLGRHEEAVAEFDRAIALDPNLFEARYLYAFAAREMGQLEKAVELYKRAAELAPDDYRTAPALQQMYRDLGKMPEARQAARMGIERAELALARHPDVPGPAALGATMFAALGEREKALEWSERALMIAPGDPFTIYNIACVCALIGESDRAVDLLERWLAPGNKATGHWLATDSDFDLIRTHPRFQALLARNG